MSASMVSVIVPSFRMARFLPEMLDTTLSQDYRPLEVIVVDGASDDGTRDVLHEYASRHPELRWISEPDDGPADAVNKGLAMAKGMYVAIQNADDLYRPGALKRAVSALQANPEASFVYGDLDWLDEQGRTSFTRRLPDFSWEAFFAWSCTFPQSSIVFRRDMGLGIGGWNGAYYSCDLDFWLRLAMHGEPVHVPEVLSGWRRYPGQRTERNRFDRIWDGYWRMIRDSEELKAASPRLRRLANASRHLLALRFYPKRSAWAIRGHVLLGLMMNPSAFRYLPGDRLARIIPGLSYWRRLRGKHRNKRAHA